MNGDDWLTVLALLIGVAALLWPHWPGDEAYRSDPPPKRRKE